MKFRYPAIIAILVVLIAMAVAGCTSTTTTSPAVSTQPAASGTPATATAAATAAASTGTSAVTLFDMGKLHSYTYRMNAGGQSIDVKTDMGTASYGGVSNARHLTSTTTMGTGDQAMVTVSDMYFDPSSDKLLGGHTKATMGGTVLYDKDIAANDASYSKSDYAGQASAAVPVPAGVESVTVPKGTFTATKYTVASSDGTTSYWIAAGVPLPVKMDVSASGSSATMELVDYS